ncbi:hypothetical protein pqer_cds_111 [Pandoravirus quercus]|uniref:Uncharacterized protein n=1 Tax=Pandoravirus quercus TaxID=2107709 RepID=A0A2U7U7Y0_9VIRU|nr:hypothetical protein pqer_cds_111 [Pandoravirus quercus]AVK74533.1 hypothetical protein pqer_cds_111 [Pandoravirus quercus]
MASTTAETFPAAQSCEMVDLTGQHSVDVSVDADADGLCALVEDHVVGSGLARSIPRRRSLVPPWVVGLVVLVVLPLAVALAVFLPWHYAGVRPHADLVDRMIPVVCAVVEAHIVDTKAVAGGMMLLYLPGLTVHFDVPMKHTASADGAPGSTLPIRTVAMPRLLRDQSWMGRDVADDYFARHPVNGTSTCYYDRDDPSGRVAMRNGIDGLDARAGYCVGATALIYVVTFATTLFVAGPHLCY